MIGKGQGKEQEQKKERKHEKARSITKSLSGDEGSGATQESKAIVLGGFQTMS